MLVLLFRIKFFRTEEGNFLWMISKLPQDVNGERSHQLFLSLDDLWSMGWQGGTHS
jgi:hypothetical protein